MFWLKKWIFCRILQTLLQDDQTKTTTQTCVTVVSYSISTEMFYRYYFKLRGLEVNLAFCLFSFLQEVVGIVGTVLILTTLSTRLKRSSFICCQDWGRLVFTCSTRGRTIRSWVHVTSVLWLGIRLNTCLPHLSIRSFVKHGAKKHMSHARDKNADKTKYRTIIKCHVTLIETTIGWCWK